QSLLEFIYGGRIQRVQDQDAYFLLSAISFYGLDEKHVQLEITPKNCLYIYEAADARPDLRERAMEVIVNNFQVVSQNPHMYKLSSFLLATIIQTIGRSPGFSTDAKEKW